MQKRCFA